MTEARPSFFELQAPCMAMDRQSAGSGGVTA